MTPAHQQQQEYIITGDDLGTIWDMLCSSTTMEEIYDRIQSRPHTSAPAPDRAIYNKSGKLPFGISDEDLYEFNEWLIKHDAQVAKAAREQVLKECCAQCPIAEETPVEDYCAETCEGCLVRKVVQESLRSQQEAEQPKEERR